MYVCFPANVDAAAAACKLFLKNLPAPPIFPQGLALCYFV
jgi:hypothetical protein